jgi:prepilin-type N-terminal cleavage/methylation domain-containing protein
MGTPRGLQGFALAELLVAVAVLGLVLAGILGLLQTGERAYATGAARVEAQQIARVGLERVARELREAGYDPTGAGIRPVLVAEPARIVFQRDLNANGVIDPTRERVSVFLSGTVLRRDAGGGGQPLAEHVRAFRLEYFDESGAPTAEPARVAAVRLGLEVEVRGAAALMETSVGIRNAAAR